MVNHDVAGFSETLYYPNHGFSVTAKRC
jgi:hypothetical protein